LYRRDREKRNIEKEGRSGTNSRSDVEKDKVENKREH
jgi:hypothetical protein